VGAEIFTNFFFGHGFSYRYARKSFKGSKDVDFGQVSEKILSHSDGPMGWGEGLGKGNQKRPTCGVPIQKPPLKMKKKFF